MCVVTLALFAGLEVGLEAAAAAAAQAAAAALATPPTTKRLDVIEMESYVKTQAGDEGGPSLLGSGGREAAVAISSPPDPLSGGAGIWGGSSGADARGRGDGAQPPLGATGVENGAIKDYSLESLLPGSLAPSLSTSPAAPATTQSVQQPLSPSGAPEALASTMPAQTDLDTSNENNGNGSGSGSATESNSGGVGSSIGGDLGSNTVGNTGAGALGGAGKGSLGGLGGIGIGGGTGLGGTWGGSTAQSMGVGSGEDTGSTGLGLGMNGFGNSSPFSLSLSSLLPSQDGQLQPGEKNLQQQQPSQQWGMGAPGAGTEDSKKSSQAGGTFKGFAGFGNAVW